MSLDKIANALLATIEKSMVQKRPAYAARFARDRSQLLSILITLLRDMKRARSDKALPELWSESERAKANLKAMRLLLKLTDAPTPAQREHLRSYSGWGGLSIDTYKSRMPGDLVPDPYGLANEYYTPTALANAVARMITPLLDELKPRSGEIRAIEPSAGIGRFLQAFEETGAHLEWTAVELSRVSSAITTALFPDADVEFSSFESWAAKNAYAQTGTFHLTVSNPPYGPRGRYARRDPHEEYKDEKRADAYFVRRSLDLLVYRGIGVFLVPAGLMTASSMEGFRERLLRRHHLSAAFRLPSVLFPGANLVTDLLVFRSRGGVELAKVDAADEFIVKGSYFKSNPDHILGEEIDEPEKGRYGYKIKGRFNGLPSLIERTMCAMCASIPWTQTPVTVTQDAWRTREIDVEGLSPVLDAAVRLGARVSEYLADVAKGGTRALDLQVELLADLRDFTSSSWLADDGGSPNPWKWKALRKLADDGNWAAQAYLNSHTKAGQLVDALVREPDVTGGHSFDPEDIIGQAKHVYRTRRYLDVAALHAFHKASGGTQTANEISTTLIKAGWMWDGGVKAPRTRLTPEADYLTGDLLTRLEVAREWEETDSQLAAQATLLAKAMKPLAFAEIHDPLPTQGWIPVELVRGWVSELNRSPVVIERDGSVYDVAGLARDRAKWAVGWMNHRTTEFKPNVGPPRIPARYTGDPLPLEPGVNDYRRVWKAYLEDEFLTWVSATPERRELLTNTYNHLFRGYKDRDFSDEPIPIARWGPRYTPHPYQYAGARKILERRGGLLAFDVGVGKTLTGLVVLARARQEGWARRPIIVVPPSLAWKWYEDVLKALPDYKCAVIGSTRYQRSQGKIVTEARKLLASGMISKEQYDRRIITSKTDTVQQQADKWQRFQAGQFDVLIVTREALQRTKMDARVLEAYVDSHSTIKRSIAERKAAAEGVKDKSKLTERQRAIVNEGSRAWIEEKLELPKGQKYVPGILWDDLGVDLIIVDEAADYKNLYKAGAREGRIPKFMGSGGEGSKRAWALDFRAHSVRQRTGGSGVVLLTATPAKNSPLEFYNLIQYIDPRTWTSRGIDDPEQFIDRYITIETRAVLDSKLDLIYVPVVTGFTNLNELRDALFSVSEFKTADDVKLQISEARLSVMEIPLGPAQERKYQAGLATIEDEISKPGRTNRNKIMGIQGRLAAVALHPDLDEGYNWDTALNGGLARRTVSGEWAAKAWEERGWRQVDEKKSGEIVMERNLPRPVYRSPKIVACAKRVASQTTCGHIIFCQPTAPHVWMREVLVELGVPRERIAILNAKATPKTIARQQISKGFNGDPDTGTPPEYDVVIANSVAYEGLDLQVRTCAIHHLDLPWTPSDLIQRNGRGLRQGNSQAVIDIVYYKSARSFDGQRFVMINGKSGWLFLFLRSKKAEISNPASKEVDYIKMLVDLSRNPDETRKKVEAKREEREREARAAAQKRTFEKVRQVNRLFESAREETDPEKSMALQKSAEKALSDVLAVPDDVYPWKEIVKRSRERKLVLSTKEEQPPLYEGLRILQKRRRFSGEEVQAIEIGREFTDYEKGGTWLGYRVVGQAKWRLVRPSSGWDFSVEPENLPWSTTLVWPADEDEVTETQVSAYLLKLKQQGSYSSRWEDVGWLGAADAWVVKWWPTFEVDIRQILSRRDSNRIPVVRDGVLALVAGAEILKGEALPPTRVGWERYVELGRKNKELKVTELVDVSRKWWQQPLKRTFRSDQRVEASTETEEEPGVVSVGASEIPLELHDRRLSRDVIGMLDSIEVGKLDEIHGVKVRRDGDTVWSVRGERYSRAETVRAVVAQVLVKRGGPSATIKFRVPSAVIEVVRTQLAALGAEYPTEARALESALKTRVEGDSLDTLELRVGLLPLAIRVLRAAGETDASSFLSHVMEASDRETKAANRETKVEKTTPTSPPAPSSTSAPAPQPKSTPAPSDSEVMELLRRSLQDERKAREARV